MGTEKYEIGMGGSHRIDFPYAYHHVMNRADAKRWAILHERSQILDYFRSIFAVQVRAFKRFYPLFAGQ